ncbi:MAG: hypothetical protein WD025_02255 [Bacteriovoracaceae bacterium]
MKLTILFIVLSFAAFAQNKVSENKVEQFDQAMMESIHKVIKQNPEKYETRNPGRFPASVVEPVTEDRVQSDAEDDSKMDILNNKAIGLPKW